MIQDPHGIPPPNSQESNAWPLPSDTLPSDALAADWLALQAAVRPDALAVVGPAIPSFTWQQLDAAVTAWIASAPPHVWRPGAAVALAATDPQQVVLALHAALRSRAVLVPLHPAWPDAERSRQLQVVGATAVVEDDTIVPLAVSSPQPEPYAAVCPTDVHTQATHTMVELGGLCPDSPVWNDWMQTQAREPDPERGWILFTSGTTGIPKAAVLSRAALLASAIATGRGLQVGPADRWLLCMPTWHVGGLMILLRGVVLGACSVIAGRFDVLTFVRTCKTWEVTCTSLVPTMVVRLARSQARLDPPLRFSLVGGGPSDSGVLAAADACGLRPRWTWGMTECASQIATAGEPSAGGPPTPAGLPVAGTEVRVHPRPDTGLAGVGELLVRGPQVMLGYLAADGSGHIPVPARDADGWFATGDLGRVRADGWVEVASRRTDLVVRGGENVYPAMIEAALSTVPGVAELAAVGVPDAEWGQVPVVVWVAQDGVVPHTVEAAMAAVASTQLPRAAWPARYVRVDALPHTPTGKLQRRALADLVTTPTPA